MSAVQEGDQATFVSTVQRYFANLFGNDELRAKVPFLTPTLVEQQLSSQSSSSSTLARLVRWRCMIQDTSLGNEVLPRHFRTSDGTKRNGLFGAASRISGGTSAVDAIPSDGGFGSLSTMCGVSLPGQTTWARLADEGLDVLGGADLTVTQEDGSQATAADANNASSLKDKLPRGEGMAVLLKVYDEDLAESLQVARIVDVLGVLDKCPLPSADWTSMGTASGESSSSPVHTTLHVISVEQDRQRSTEGKIDAEARRTLVHLLSNSMAGDDLAAEWLLLALLARIHTRSAGQTLGSLSLNLSGLPTAPSDDRKPAVYHLLQAVLPLLADQTLNLTHLNAPTTNFEPRSEADEQGLRAGRLQLVPGTVLFVDEGTMQEGQLKESGIANIRALSAVLQTNKLPYAFPFSSHEMDTHLPCVVMSQGKSFLPVDVQVPLQAEASKIDALFGDSPLAAEDEGAQLPGLRRYLAAVQHHAAQSNAFTIPVQVSDKIQDDFVQTRKTNQAIIANAKDGEPTAKTITMDTQEDLARTIQVARLLCLSNGHSQLRWQDWQEAKRLDEERQKRLAKA